MENFSVVQSRICVFCLWPQADGGIDDVGAAGKTPRVRAPSDGAASEAFTEFTGVDSLALTTASEVAKRTIVQVEEKEEGAVSFSVYIAHLKAMGGLPMFLMVALGVGGAQAAVVISG